MPLLTRNQKIELFLKELTELSKKHKFVIGGCGCCGSPFIQDLDEEGHYSNKENLHGDFGWIEND